MQPMYEAMYPAALGDIDTVMDLLERGYHERSDWMYTMGTQPWFKPYHGHPRFMQLMEQMKLAHAT